MNNWADKSTPRGLVESIIEPIISGGAQPQHINKVVDRLLAFHRSYVPDEVIVLMNHIEDVMDKDPSLEGKIDVDIWNSVTTLHQSSRES